MKRHIKHFPYLILILSIISFLATLFFSEILKLPPCVLCWYQRIALYPIIPIAAVGILRKDKHAPLYILPLSIAGWLISIYHNLLFYHILPEAIAPCQNGVSCTDKLSQTFGFIDIPFGSFIVFTIINICTIIYLKHRNNIEEL